MWAEHGKGSRSEHGKRFQPRIKRPFEVDDAPAIEAKTRGFLARYIAISAWVAVTVTAGYGLLSGNYAAVEIVWAIAGPIIGAVVAFYFGPHGKEAQ